MSREEEILVLYGSQTGNSEQAAQDFCNAVPEKLSTQAIANVTGKKDVTVTARHMQLDDFLELEKAPWTRFVVIFTSSYGVGQAPLGCYRFRDLADALVTRYKEDGKADKILNGVTYAMCGLGDSMYTTFFENPTVIDNALQMAGAKRVGPLGKADASGEGEQDQQKVIQQWIRDIWPVVIKEIVTEPPSVGSLELATKETVKICCKINPDFQTEESKSGGSLRLSLLVPIVVAAVGVVWYFMKRDKDPVSIV